MSVEMQNLACDGTKFGLTEAKRSKLERLFQPMARALAQMTGAKLHFLPIQKERISHKRHL